MKLSFRNLDARFVSWPVRGATRGSAVLVVLVLLACLASMLVASSSALHAMKQELKLLDERQLKKYERK